MPPLNEITFSVANIKTFTFNALQENTYVVYDETKQCVIIDPGCYDRDEKEVLKKFILENGLVPVALLNTHCHIDHIVGNAFVKSTFRVDLYIHPIEKEILLSQKIFAPYFGFDHLEESEAEHFFKDEDTYNFGNTVLKIVFVPGHSPGHVAFVDEKSKSILSGDVLFYQSIGRTDLPGGNHQTLINSIKTKLFTLENDYKVFPGHGPTTTIGFERSHNPFLK